MKHLGGILLIPMLVMVCLSFACGRRQGTAHNARNTGRSDSVGNVIRAADHYIRGGMYDRAFDELRKAEDMARSDGDDDRLIQVYNKLFVLCHDTRQYNRALGYISRAEEIVGPEGDSAENYRLLNNKAICYLGKQEYDSAMMSFARARNYAVNNPAALSTIDINIADVYFSQGNIDKAGSILEEVVQTNPTNYHPWLNLALISSERGDKARTLQLVRRTAGAPDTLPQAYLPDYYGQLTSIYLNIGDSVAAFRTLEKYLEHQTRIDSVQNADRFNELVVMYRTDELAASNKILSLELGRRNILLLTLGVIAILLVAVVYLLHRRARMEREHHKVIQQKNRQILQMEREMHEVLREQVDRRNRELATYAMEKASAAESRQTLAREAGKAAENDDIDPRVVLARLSRKLGDSEPETVARDFRVYFEQVHPRFADTLKQLHPQITNNDLRLCIFLYLGMSTKEIAALLARETRSVETARLRLRKKLGLPPAASLQDYLCSISPK